MRKISFGFLLCLIPAFLPSTAVSAVLTFDDVSSTSSHVPIPNGYGGFNWNMNVIHKNLHPGSGYDLGRVSGDYSAWHYEPASVSAISGTFDFNGAYFASAWDESLQIELGGWNGATLLFANTISVNNQGPTWFLANYLNIDTLKVTSLGQQFVMDDFTYDAAVTAIPLPAALPLFLSGLVGLGLVGRKRRKKGLAA